MIFKELQGNFLQYLAVSHICSKKIDMKENANV